jgi:hypothetical protein
MGERADEVRPPQEPRRYSDEPIAPEEPARTAEPVEGKDPEEIRRDIERTREEMGETIDAIQERISPENIKDNVRQQTIGRAKEFVDDASARVRETSAILVDKAEPVLEHARDKIGPVGEQAEEQLKRGRARYRQLQEENPTVARMLPIGLLAAIVFLWLLLRRGSKSSPEEQETEQYSARVYRVPGGHVVSVRPVRE